MKFKDYLTKLVVIYDGGEEGNQFVLSTSKARYVIHPGTQVRYVVVIGDDVYGMSENPKAKKGFDYWLGDSIPGSPMSIKLGKHLGTKIKLTQCPKPVQKAINDHIQEKSKFSDKLVARFAKEKE